MVVCFWARKFRRWDRLKSVPTPRKPLSGIPTAQIGGREMIVQCVSCSLPRCSFDAHFKGMRDNKRPLTPMSVKNVKRWQSSGELNWTLDFHLWIISTLYILAFCDTCNIIFLSQLPGFLFHFYHEYFLMYTRGMIVRYNESIHPYRVKSF